MDESNGRCNAAHSDINLYDEDDDNDEDEYEDKDKCNGRRNAAHSDGMNTYGTRKFTSNCNEAQQKHGMLSNNHNISYLKHRT
jgi:hypothetical protein